MPKTENPPPFFRQIDLDFCNVFVRIGYLFNNEILIGGEKNERLG
jgi:hypothetical protein